MNLKKLVFTATLLTATIAGAHEFEERPEEPLTVLVDSELGMTMGADSLYSGHVLYKRLDDYIIDTELFTRDDWAGVLLRLTKTSLYDHGIWANTIMVVNHEIFGHGARLREFDIDPSYEIDAPFPFGKGGGATKFDAAQFAALPPLRRIAAVSGGVETSEVFARRMFLRAFERGQWDYRDAVLFGATNQDQSSYIWSLRSEDDILPQGHDIEAYIALVNLYHGREVVDRDDLQVAALLNILDGATLLSISHQIGYIWNGDVVREIPALELGRLRLLPGARLDLAPYGPEYGIRSYFMWDDMAGFTYFRMGQNGDIDTYGAGLQLNDVVEVDDFSFGGRVDLWSQPKTNTAVYTSETNFGALGTVSVDWTINETWSLYGELGAKMDGWVPGECMGSGLIARAGVRALVF